MRRLFATACVLLAGLVGLAGCSKSDEPGMKVKDLKSRGLKDPDKDTMTPKRGERPGVLKGGAKP